jgi:hypothetical protein
MLEADVTADADNSRGKQAWNFLLGRPITRMMTHVVKALQNKLSHACDCSSMSKFKAMQS